MWNDAEIRRDTIAVHVEPTEPGAASLAYGWVLDYLQEHKGKIPVLEDDQFPCPAHVPAYWLKGKLWLMGPLFIDWLNKRESVRHCPGVVVRYFMALGAHLTYLVFSPSDKVPVIRLPNDGSYVFRRSAIILRGAVDG